MDSARCPDLNARVAVIAEIAAEPWKNGGGITRTIAARDDDWRVSMAEVARDGPYSRFDGIARISCVLRGAGVVLRNGGDSMMLEPFRATAYDGAMHWQAALIDGPVSALNTMTRIGAYRANVAAIETSIDVKRGCAAIVVALDAPCRIGDADVLDAGRALVVDRVERAFRVAPMSTTRTPAMLVTIEPL